MGFIVETQQVITTQKQKELAKMQRPGHFCFKLTVIMKSRNALGRYGKTIFFWIKQDDLRTKKFDKCWLISPNVHKVTERQQATMAKSKIGA